VYVFPPGVEVVGLRYQNMAKYSDYCESKPSTVQRAQCQREKRHIPRVHLGYFQLMLWAEGSIAPTKLPVPERDAVT
jgi:hypothetical protein